MNIGPFLSMDLPPHTLYSSPIVGGLAHYSQEKKKRKKKLFECILSLFNILSGPQNDIKKNSMLSIVTKPKVIFYCLKYK